MRARYFKQGLFSLTLYLLLLSGCFGVLGRVYGCDVVAVSLVYSTLQLVFLLPRSRAVSIVFFLFCGLECAQWLDYVALLGLEKNTLMSTLLGRTFCPIDFLAYFLGVCLVAQWEILEGGALWLRVKGSGKWEAPWSLLSCRVYRRGQRLGLVVG